MEKDLKEKERNNTMPRLTDIQLDDKINIDQINNVRATDILYHSLNSNNEEFTLERLPVDTSNYDKSIKIILIGISNVGKSSIFYLLNDRQYNNYIEKTIGLQHYNYFIKINNVIIRMQIWDTVGQEKIDSLTINYYKNTDVAIFVYAINNKNSFYQIEECDTQLNNKEIINDSKDNEQKNINENTNNNEKNRINNKGLIKVLLGNKKDLENERKVTYEQGEKLAKDKNFEIFKEISCNSEIEENGENKNIDDIIDLFDDIGKKVYKDHIKNDRGRLNSSSYCYQATNSILYSNENNDKKDKSNCCCSVF